MTVASKEAEIRRAIDETPHLSAAASRLLEVTGTPDHALVEVIHIVKHDAILTSQVLKVVNSAAFGRRVEIRSIEQAVSLLGEDMVVSTAMSEAAALLFGKKLDGYGAEEGELWRHNLKTGIAAKFLAPFALCPVNPDQAFTCGLLHDLGKAVISDFLHDTPAKILAALEQKKIPDYVAAERALLGIDHAEAGYELCRKWHLPSPLPEVTRWHHQPFSADAELRPLVYVVHLADIVAMMSGSGTGADAFQYSIDRKYVDFIELDELKLAGLLVRVEQEFTKVAAAFWGGSE